MKMLITAGSGNVGLALARYFTKMGLAVHATFLSHKIPFEGFSSHQLDITDRVSTMSLIRRIRPDVTVHSAALTNMDKCEIDRSAAYGINVEGTKNVVEACVSVGSKVVYVSTSNVFDGSRSTFLEEHEPHPINYYGWTKAEGERFIASSGLSYLILRTDLVYCHTEEWQRQNFVNLVLRKLELGETVSTFIDWYNTPTLVDNFAEVTYALLGKNREGVFHVVGSEFLNRYEVALKIAGVFGKNRALISHNKSDEGNLAAKRANVNLNNAKAQSETGIRLLNVEEGLHYMLKHYKEASLAN